MSNCNRPRLVTVALALCAMMLGSAFAQPVVAAADGKCCPANKRILVTTGEAEESVANTITKVSVSIRISDAVQIDTAHPTQPNPNQFVMAQSVTGSIRPTSTNETPPARPDRSVLDSIAKRVLADATARTQRAIQLLQSTAVERLQTVGVSLQPTSVYVPKLGDSVQTGYSASNTLSFRIETSAMGTLLSDLLSVGITNIDFTANVPTEEALESGIRNAIRRATKRALARGEIAVSSLVGGASIDIKDVSVMSSGMAMQQPPMHPQPMFLSARAESATAGGAPGVVQAGESRVQASVSVSLEVASHSGVLAIAPTDLD